MAATRQSPVARNGLEILVGQRAGLYLCCQNSNTHARRFCYGDGSTGPSHERWPPSTRSRLLS